MATKTRTVKTIVDDGDETKNELPPLTTWLDALDDESKVEVHTRDEEGFWNLRCTRPPNVITEDFLENLGAPAVYKLKSVRPNGTWGPQRTVRIAGMPKLEVMPANQTDPALMAQLKMFELQMKMSQDQGNKMHEIVLAMITARGNSGPTMTEMITAVTALKSATENGNGVEHIKDVIELVKEFGPGDGGGGGKSDPWDTLSKVLPKLLENKTAQPAAAAAPQKLIPGNGTVSHTAPPINNPPADPKAAEIDARLQLLAMLKEKAVKGKDPSFWADYLWENDDNSACLALLEMVNTYAFEQIWPGLLGADPELEKHRDWFERLYKAIKEDPPDEKGNDHPDTPK
jgi:hypothetical protein